jgi:hypothetical protein
MRAALLLICLAVFSYIAWSMADPHQRRSASRFATKHGLRLGGIVLVILLLLYAATQFSATPIVF